MAASYDASKHAVVAITEDLFNTMRVAGLPIGVSVLCPGWVRTNILEAGHNWPTELGARPVDDPANAPYVRHVERALAEDNTPASVADAVIDAIIADRFWVIPHQDFFDLVIERLAPHRRPPRSRTARADARNAAVLPTRRRDHRGDGAATPN